MTRSVTDVPEGTCTVSRRIGFFCPSTIGGFSVALSDV